MTTIQPLDPDFKIELPAIKWEGPMDLLLHLIRNHELDVLDLPIAFVTEKYLAYLDLMEKVDLDVASEYLVMAATLAHIKSRMMLPPDPDDEEDEDGVEEDPRAELVRRLLDYQRYKAAGAELAARDIKGRDVFLRGSAPLDAEGPPPLAQANSFSLLTAFQRILERARADITREISAERIGIQARMSQLTEGLRGRGRVHFDALFDGLAGTYDLVVTFLALLEMTKGGMLSLFQNEPGGALYVESRVVAVAGAESLEVTTGMVPGPGDGTAEAGATPATDRAAEVAASDLGAQATPDRDARPPTLPPEDVSNGDGTLERENREPPGESLKS